MESISDSKIKQIAKITSLMNQISTNLANSMYDKYNVRDRGNFIQLPYAYVRIISFLKLFYLIRAVIIFISRFHPRRDPSGSQKSTRWTGLSRRRRLWWWN